MEWALGIAVENGRLVVEGFGCGGEMEFGDISDLHGKKIRAFGDDLGGAHRLVIVSDGHRKVGRIHENEISLWNGTDTVALRNFTLPAAQDLPSLAASLLGSERSLVLPWLSGGIALL